MKTITRIICCSLVFVLGMVNQSICQSYNFYVLDPQSQWNRATANIDEATLTIKPQGIYMEYGLYLTISAKGSQFYGNANPPLEIVMNFCLPDKPSSMIHGCGWTTKSCRRF